MQNFVNQHRITSFWIIMHITAQNVGKKFNREWIFRGLELNLQTGQSYTFVGANGSGKSTAMQVLAGAVPPTEGQIFYQTPASVLSEDDWYKQIVLAAPYLELIEEFSFLEVVAFHQKFKPFKNSLTAVDLAELLWLTAALHKPIKYFSSGMKQRLKLGLAFFSDVPIVMLDEPTANLDTAGTDWYRATVQTQTAGQLLIICSNQQNEYDFCSNIINLADYK